jgi:hypothetical protein
MASRHTYYSSKLFSESGFNLNQISDAKDAAEFSIAKDNWGSAESRCIARRICPVIMI